MLSLGENNKSASKKCVTYFQKLRHSLQESDALSQSK